MSHYNLDHKLLLIGWLLIFTGVTIVWHNNLHYCSIIWVLLIILGAYNLILRIASKVIADDEQLSTIQEPTYYPHVTIIIPAHNEEKIIEDTVLELLDQDYPFFDVLVMNDRSTDSTATVLKNIADNIETILNPKISKSRKKVTPISSLNANQKRFSYVTRTPEETPGKSAVLNDALCYTPSDYLLILDADARIPLDFLRRVVPQMMRTPYGAMQVQRKITQIKTDQPGSFLVFCQGIEYALDAALQTARHKLDIAVELRGSGMMVRREALYSTNGWTESALTDDLDLSSKLHISNWHIGFMMVPSVTEQGLLDWQSLYKQRLRWAQGSMQRYLSYMHHIIFSFAMPVQLKLDTLVYSLVFCIPVLFLIEAIYAIATLNGLLLLSWLGAWITLCLAFMVSFLACKTPLWGDAPLKRKLGLSITGGAYMIAIWVPAIYHALWRLITQNKPASWEQTKRY